MEGCCSHMHCKEQFKSLLGRVVSAFKSATQFLRRQSKKKLKHSLQYRSFAENAKMVCNRLKAFLIKEKKLWTPPQE